MSSFSPADNLSPSFAPHDPSDTTPAQAWVDLAGYTTGGYQPGRGLFTQLAWYYVSLLLFESGWFIFGGPKRWLLRLFGARVGIGLVIKPQVRIKYPWRLSLGDHCWLGQGVWIDNLADVRLGDHVCLSQAAYLCTGDHDFRRPSFDLIVRPIVAGDGVWIGANALILSGVTLGANSVVAAASVVTKDVAPAAILGGNPARQIGTRAAPELSS